MSGWQPQMQASCISSRPKFTELFSTAAWVSSSSLEKLSFGLHTQLHNTTATNLCWAEIGYADFLPPLYYSTPSTVEGARLEP